jgi:hypothetical protein
VESQEAAAGLQKKNHPDAIEGRGITNQEVKDTHLTTTFIRFFLIRQDPVFR